MGFVVRYAKLRLLGAHSQLGSYGSESYENYDLNRSMEGVNKKGETVTE